MIRWFGAPLLAAVAAMLLLLGNARPAPQRPLHDARLSHLLGMTVQDPNAQALGTVKDFVLDASSARLEYAIIGSGGVLGLGGHERALPASALTMATIVRGTLGTGITKQQWRNYPPFRGDVAALPDPPRPAATAAAGPSPTGPATSRQPVQPSRLELTSNLLDNTVMNRQHQTLGTIADLLLDLDRQKPALALIRTRSLLRRPETFAVPLSLLSRSADDKLLLDVNPHLLQQAPLFTEQAWNAAASQGANAIYRVPGSLLPEDTHSNQNTQGKVIVMEKIDSLESLLLHEVKDLYHAEKQLVKALPKVAKKASAPELKQAIEEHLRQTEGQVNRLEQVFEMLGQPPKAVTCKAMQGILEEGEETMKLKATPETLDAAIITAAQKVEHYEIASYGSLLTWAKTLGRNDILALLKQTLAEEKEADEKLTELATSGINQSSAEKLREAA